MLLKICRSHTEGFASFTVYFFKKSHVGTTENKKKHNMNWLQHRHFQS